jgi:hypothetical protein
MSGSRILPERGSRMLPAPVYEGFKSLAEREGFEPSVQVFSPYNGLAILSPDATLRNPNHLHSRSRTKTDPM